MYSVCVCVSVQSVRLFSVFVCLFSVCVFLFSLCVFDVCVCSGCVCMFCMFLCSVCVGVCLMCVCVFVLCWCVVLDENVLSLLISEECDVFLMNEELLCVCVCFIIGSVQGYVSALVFAVINDR